MLLLRLQLLLLDRAAMGAAAARPLGGRPCQRSRCRGGGACRGAAPGCGLLRPVSRDLQLALLGAAYVGRGALGVGVVAAPPPQQCRWGLQRRRLQLQVLRQAVQGGLRRQACSSERGRTGGFLCVWLLVRCASVERTCGGGPLSWGLWGLWGLCGAAWAQVRACHPVVPPAAHPVRHRALDWLLCGARAGRLHARRHAGMLARTHDPSARERDVWSHSAAH